LEAITEKIARSVSFLSRFTSTLSQWTKVTIYNTLVLPHFIFSTSILYLGNKNEQNRLQKLQNRAMRIILSERRDTSVRSMLKKLNWLPVDKFLIYQNMILIYKIQNSLTPQYLTNKLENHVSMHSYNTRNKNNFYVTTKSKRSTENALYHKGLLEFDKLSQTIKAAPSVEQFKKMLKNELMGE